MIETPVQDLWGMLSHPFVAITNITNKMKSNQSIRLIIGIY